MSNIKIMEKTVGNIFSRYERLKTGECGLAVGEFCDIDGSVMEGGGQVLRMSAGLSSLLAKPIRISKIRAGRPKTGLKSQHLSGLGLIRDLTGGELEGADLGSPLITLRPGPVRSGVFSADTRTAGAVCLLGQISLPCAVFSPGPVTLELRGGTNTDMAPQIDEFTEILAPNLEKFGVKFEFEVVRKGFFPKGGGLVKLFINPIKSLSPITLTDPGTIEQIYGWSFCSGNLPVKVAEQMTSAARKHLRSSGCDGISDISIDIETYKEDRSCCPDNGSGIVIIARTSTGCILGGSAIGSVKQSAHETGVRAAEEFLEAVECGGCVDKHIQDQLIIFMALAPGESRLVTGPLTLHTETAIHIASSLTGARFRVDNCDNNKAWMISCQGIGYVNPHL